MNRIFRFCLPLLLLLWGCAQESPKENTPNAAEAAVWAKYRAEGWKNHGCDLVTDAELETMFAFNGKESILNSRQLPNQAFCLRTWNKPDWKERESANEKENAPWLNPQNRIVVQLFDYSSEEHARLQMSGLRRDRRNTYEEDVNGIGDEALWSTSTVTLLVRKGQYVLNLTLEIDDKPHDNLEKAKAVAALALKKM